MNNTTPTLNPENSRATKPRYQDQTLRPIVCLVFVVPLILCYELGAIWFGGDNLRSGIDQWLSRGLNSFGVGHLVLLPILTAGILIWWHHRRQDDWQLRLSTCGGMLVESAGLGLILFWAASAISLVAFSGPATAQFTEPLALPFSGLELNLLPSILSSIGSGLYEELVFRLVLLLPAIIWLHKKTKNIRAAQIIGIVVISILFAALHYNLFNPAGAQFNAGSFAFRFIASVVFSILFLFRGFGIAVGTHVVYDILVQT